MEQEFPPSDNAGHGSRSGHLGALSGEAGEPAGRRTSEQMSAEDLEKYETEMELSLYREYKDIVGQFSYVVETERRFYLANSVEMVPRNTDGEVYFELRLADAWVWDMYRPARFVKQVRVVTFKDVNIEEVENPSCACRNSCPKRRHTSIGCVRQSVGRGCTLRR